MRKYELTYLISDSVPEKDLNKVTGIVSGFISDLGGKVDKEDIWGRRKLAYPIQKQDFATYITLFFGLPAEKVIEFERDMHATTTILRHLLIVKEYGSETITLTADEIAETGDIEEVVGGEKSFEAVVGETEDSRTLMAKRDDSEAESEKLKAESIAEEQVSEVKSEKLKVKSATKEKTVKEETKNDEIVEEKVEEKVEQPKKETKVKTEKTEKETKAKKTNDESERLSKLNDQLDDILKDEL